VEPRGREIDSEISIHVARRALIWPFGITSRFLSTRIRRRLRTRRDIQHFHSIMKVLIEIIMELNNNLIA